MVNGHKSAAASSHSFILIRQTAAVVMIRTDSPDGGTDIATLARRSLAEVCTVPVFCVVLTVSSSHTIVCL